jgi:hypothetical protein
VGHSSYSFFGSARARWADLLGLSLTSLQGTVLTSAIDTVVGGTSAAHCRQLLRNCLPGTVESDGRIIGGHAAGTGKGLHGLSGQINLLYCCTVLGLQVVDNFLNACTGLSLQFRLIILLPGGKPLIHSLGASCIVPVVVGERVSQDSVKPCNRALRLPQLASVLHGFHISCLQDVLSPLPDHQPCRAGTAGTWRASSPGQP